MRTRLGALDGPRSEIFGHIEDAAFLATGAVAVLDSRLIELRLYDAEGNLVQTLGREGRGPGEFFVPEAVARLGEGLTLLDRGNARVTIYGSVAGDSLALLDELRLDLQAWDLCTIGERIFLSSDGADETIVEIDTAGRVVRRFGEPADGVELPNSAPELQQSLRQKYRRGQIACSPEGITWASLWTRSVKHYDLAGRKVYDFELADLSPVSPQLTAQGTVRYGPAPGSAHADAIVNVVHSGHQAFVQATRVVYSNQSRELLTFALDLRTGESRLLQVSIPRLHAVSGDELVMSVEDPFPQLLLGSRRF